MKNRLKAARVKIDRLDRRIAGLLARRFALAGPLKALKKNVTDRSRERQVLKNAAAGGKNYAPYITAVFSEIIRQSKKSQLKKLRRPLVNKCL